MEETIVLLLMLLSQWLRGCMDSKIRLVMSFVAWEKFQGITHRTSRGDREDAQRLEVIGAEITWVVFRVKFLDKYFPEDVCNKKEIEFLELKQGNMIVVEYTAKFEELVKFYPHYNGAAMNGSKHIKFENGACSTPHKSVSDKKGKNQYRGKPYSTPTNKGRQIAANEKNTSWRETPVTVKCFKSGELGHHANEWKNNVLGCFKCGKTCHCIADCKSVCPTCYNSGEQGHINANCQKLKKAQSRGKVYALLGLETTSDDHFIRDETHSFISLDCVERYGLKLSSMDGNMIVDTLTLGTVTTLWVCQNCPLTIYGKNFGMDLVCLPLRNLDVILGMNWLEFNHVHINYFNKTVSFPEFDACDDLFVFAKQVDEFEKDDIALFMILASMKDESKVVIGEFLVACDFPKVFTNDISGLSTEREVGFAIDLVPSTSLVSMAPYRMFTSELGELKKQLEDLLAKKFVRPSDSSWGASCC
ncbi:uncharacterized protein LOC127136205 [Lathyrus oleraceus]|uniref:uncharacterized protein LOC127136205 n=1 Tax=Pisum sativum TaxID=3888 RepID=UPI0021D0DB2E|nr:uncharacterized protein LOC127136205 [Pisum sativum]